MKEIQLTQGKVAFVDDDYESLSKHKWCADKGSYAFYAVRNCRCTLGGKRHSVRMHRQLMGTPLGMETDHQDGNGLNNQRYNLRVCTKAENQYNQRCRTGSNKFKGVSWYKQTNKWQAQIMIEGKNVSLGYFDSEIEAAKKYDEAALRLFGEFAFLNFKQKEAS